MTNPVAPASLPDLRGLQRRVFELEFAVEDANQAADDARLCKERMKLRTAKQQFDSAYYARYKRGAAQ